MRQNAFEVFNQFCESKKSFRLARYVDYIAQQFPYITGIPSAVLRGAWNPSYLKSMQQRLK